MQLRYRYLALALIMVAAAVFAAEPHAPQEVIIIANHSQNITPGSLLNTSGGTITEMNLTATTQNYRWKGFVGNISGSLALLDSSSNALKTWPMSTITGEIYATRNSTALDWINIQCADNSIITAEETNLSITASSVDSIRNTFDTKVHDAFYVGYAEIAENTCNTTALNVNNTEQSTYFQEVLLSDGQNLIYTSILENSTYGFNNASYDFQIIVAEHANQGEMPRIPYYFYVELV